MNKFYEYVRDEDLSVNIEKTKMVRFRKKEGRMKRCRD